MEAADASHVTEAEADISKQEGVDAFKHGVEAEVLRHIEGVQTNMKHDRRYMEGL